MTGEKISKMDQAMDRKLRKERDSQKRKMKRAIEKLRNFKEETFLMETYIERVGWRFGGTHVVHRKVCTKGLLRIRGETMMALFEQGWLKVVEIEKLPEQNVPGMQKTHIIRYKFVDLKQGSDIGSEVKD